MKTLCAVCLCCLLLAPFAACHYSKARQRGAMKTDNRPLGIASFNKIQIDAALDARITAGGASSLSFRGPASALAHLRSEVKDSTLRIFSDDGHYITEDGELTAAIHVFSLSGVDMRGAGKAIVNGTVNAPELSLRLSGAGSVNVDELHTQRLSANLSGAGSLILRSGDVDSGIYKISGSGAVRMFGVTQRSATVKLSGVADVELSVAGRLDVSISGAGAVKYKGYPALMQHISGVGSIVNAN